MSTELQGYNINDIDYFGVSLLDINSREASMIERNISRLNGFSHFFNGAISDYNIEQHALTIEGMAQPADFALQALERSVKDAHSLARSLAS